MFMMLTSRSLKVALLVVGVLVVGLGMYGAFQEADATGGRVRQFTRTYTWSKPLWEQTKMETGFCPHNWSANTCNVKNRYKEVRYRFYDVYEITETYLDTGNEVYMIQSSKKFLRREKRKKWEHWDICPNSRCPSNQYYN